jgi:hypothetical protein
MIFLCPLGVRVAGLAALMLPRFINAFDVD